MTTPPFDECAKAAMLRSISPTSRTLIGIASIPSNGAALDGAELANPGGYGGVSKGATTQFDLRRDVLEEPRAISRSGRIRTLWKPSVALPPGRAKLETKPAPTGSMTTTNTIGTVRVACSNGATVP